MENTEKSALAIQAEQLEEMVQNFTKDLENITDIEALEKMEEEVIAEIEEHTEKYNKYEYKLPAGVNFDGKNYSREGIGNDICMFINTQEISWQYTLGLYELYNFWKNPNNFKITHGILDSTLRVLDQCKFKGFNQWKSILIINEYMKPNHEAYQMVNNEYIAISKKHDAILQRMQLINPIKEGLVLE